MAIYSPKGIRRVLLKISGEFLAGGTGFGYNQEVLDQLTDDIIELKKKDYEIGMVIGGGNYFRGKELTVIDQTAADNVGMLATIQNAIVVSEVLKQKKQFTKVFSAFPIEKIADLFTFQRADKSMDRGVICFFAGGTGNPFFTTDTAAILRAIELKCDLVLKGTNVDGIYTADPKKDPSATFIQSLTYTEALSKQLKVMDMTAFSLARDYKIPIKVFSIKDKGNIVKAVTTAEVGTFVTED